MQEIDMKPAWLTLAVLLVCSMTTAPLAEGEATMRIRPIEPSEWSPKILNKIESIGRVRLPAGKDQKGDSGGSEKKRPPSMLKTVAHHPDLVVPLLDFATVISHNGALSPRESELLALRVAWNCRSEFEWGHHADYARDAGLSDEEIARVPLGANAHGWSATERALLEAADELHGRQLVSDEVWSKLAANYDEKQLIEILFVVGEYTMLSMVVNSSGVELEPGYERLPTIAAPE
jgi:alkylhydroperoxidase family enzyme